MRLRSNLDLVAAGPGPWSLVAPRGADLSRAQALLAAEGVEVQPLQFDPTPSPAWRLAEMVATAGPAGLIMAGLPGWESCPWFRAVSEAAALADLPAAFVPIECTPGRRRPADLEGLQ